MNSVTASQNEVKLDVQRNRKHREKLARLRSKQIELAYRKAPVGFALFDAKEFRLLSCNEAWSEIVGMPPDQVLGNTILEIAPGIPDVIEMFEIVAGGAKIENQFLKGELPSRPGVERHWLVNYHPILDEQGGVEAVSTITLEIAADTQRVAIGIQADLINTEAKYRGLLEAAPDAMIVVNQRGEIVLLNLQAEKQFGYSRNELVGQQVTSIIPEGFAERLIADGTRTAAEALAQQIGTGIELYGCRKDGSRFPIEIMLSPLESVEGVLITAAIRDITTRKKAALTLLQKIDELNRSNGELEQFAYIASHDLQEPLRMVSSYTQLLAKRYRGKLDSDADEFIAFAVDGASRMQRLILDLLVYSRVGTVVHLAHSISSEDALQRALINLRAAIAESGAQITQSPLPMVMANTMQLTQLFQNLIGNAIKYRGTAAPRIKISALKCSDHIWEFSIEDNGLGIEPQYFERIFGLFQRLHRRDEFSGTGIGLAICKKIVERHGGTISVQSQYGRGSTFQFTMNAGESRA